MKQATKVHFTENTTALLKVEDGETVTILEISTVQTNGFQPYSVSNISVEDFDALESFDVSEDNTVSAFISNNRDAFDSLHSSI